MSVNTNTITSVGGTSGILQAIKENKPQFRNSADAIAYAIHLAMKQAGFRCVGCGETNDETASNLLIPTDWNKSSDSYSFRYKHPKSNMTYLINLLPMEGQLIISGFAVENNVVHNFEANITDFVNTGVPLDNYDKLYKNLDKLVSLFKTNIVNKFFPPEKEGRELPVIDKNKTPNTSNRDYDPLRVPSFRSEPTRHSPLMEEKQPSPWMEPTGNPLIPPGYQPPPQFNPFGVGQEDVFPPLGGPTGAWGPGGNLVGPGHPGFGPEVMDPRGRGKGYPPTHPPGARFDPFDPSGAPGSTFNPDKDEAPPPGFENMYL